MNKQEIEKAICVMENLKYLLIEVLGNKNNEKEFDVVIEMLEKQLTNGWIPVSERLPEKDGEYLCTTVYGNVTDIWIDTFYKGEWTRPADVEFDYEILTWQPLPEPYKEDDGE